jgi:Tfp pilus assembly protein PilV
MNGKQIALLIISLVLLGVTSFLGYLYYTQNQEFRIQPITTPNKGNNQEMRINMQNDTSATPSEETAAPDTTKNSVQQNSNKKISNTNSPDVELENLEKELNLETFEDL